MGGIRTEITLKNGVSPVLNKIVKQLNLLQGAVTQNTRKFSELEKSVKGITASKNKLASTNNKVAVTEKFIAKAMNSVQAVNSKIIRDAEREANVRTRSINKIISGVRTATNAIVSANERQKKSNESAAKSHDKAITRIVSGIYRATDAFTRATLNKRITAQKNVESYVAGIKREQDATAKATQRQLQDILNLSLKKIELSYKVQQITENINREAERNSKKRVQSELADQAAKLKGVLNTSLKKMEWARKTADFAQSVDNKAWANTIKRGQAEHAQMMKTHQDKCASILKQFELGRKTKAWLAAEENKAWANTVKRSQQEEQLIRKREAAAIAAVKRQEAEKWKAFDKKQAQMGKMIAQSEKRNQREEQLIRKREAAAIAAVQREGAAKLAAWDKQQAKMGQMIAKAEKRNQKEKQMLPAINANTIAQKKHNLEIERGTSKTDMLWSKIKSIGGAYLGIQTAGSIINTADSLAANDARLSLMVKEGESVQQLSDSIYEAAMRSRVGYLTMSDAVAKVGIQAGNLFDNSAQMVRFMETFNKMGVISKATSQQASAAMNQLIQALSFGQLRGDELKSILENMPMVAHALADELTRIGNFGNLPDKLKKIGADGKVTADEIRELGYEGQISADTVVRAMLNGSEKIDNMAKNMTWTWAQVWEVFKNSALRAFTPVLNGISKIIQTERFQRFAAWVDKVVKKISSTVISLWITLGPVFGAIFDAVANIGDVISNNWSWIAPIVMGIVGAMVAYKTITMAVITWTAILNGVIATKNLLTSISAAKTAMATGATFAQTAAQWGLNAALLACPITWIILGIISIIAVVYLVVAAINEFAGTSISATGIVCGAVMWLGAVIYDQIAFIWNAILSFLDKIINKIITACEWIYNAFNGGFTGWIDGVKNAFWTFIDWALKKIKPLIEVWDKINGTNYSNSLQSVVDSKIEGTKTSNYKKFDRDVLSSKLSLDYVNPNDAYSKGYELGDKIASKVEGLFGIGNNKNNKNPLEEYAGDFSKALEGGFDKSSVDDPLLNRIAKNTGETAKNTKKSDDNFKYLRQLAERDSMSRSQLMNFKVDMSNVNHIKSGLDVDEVMRRLAQELYNEVVSKMQGAY